MIVPRHKHSIVLVTTKISSARQLTLVHVVVWWRMARKCTKIYIITHVQSHCFAH